MAITDQGRRHRLPGTTLVVLAVVESRSHPIAKRERVIGAAPVVSGLLLALFVVRVGGDFMHARLLLAPTFLVLLPALMVRLSRRTAVACAVIATWTIAVGIICRDGRPSGGIGDERAGYLAWTRRNHPIEARVFVFADRPSSSRALLALLQGKRRLLEGIDIDLPMDPDRPGPLVYSVGRLGTGGATMPIEATVADTLGLANPLGARITKTLPGWTGHEKPLPRAWLIADFADPSAQLPQIPHAQVDAARRALQCGELAELLASVRDPLTPSRFWANLTGSLRRTRLVVPADPAEAEHKFCGARAQSTVVTASTSWDLDGAGKYTLLDGELGSRPGSLGYTSTAGPPQWIELRFATPRTVNGVVLHPLGDGVGFPLDATIQVWDGTKWLDRARREVTLPVAEPQTYAWSPADQVTRVRILVTRIDAALPRPEVKLTEIELLP